jgi:helicase
LGLKLVRDDHRPVPLREGVITPNGLYQFVEWSGAKREPGTEQLPILPQTDLASMAVTLATELLLIEDAQVLAFVSSVDRTSSVAMQIAAANDRIPPARKTKLGIDQLEATESVEALQQSLDHSFAFHNADLTLDERLTIEEGFRSGEVRCLVSTSTLSMGVNLPASAVLIVDYQKWGKSGGRWAEEPISVAEYRNMSGRAGRFGMRKDALGKSFLLSSSSLSAVGMVRKYLHGDPAPLESALLKQPLDVRLLRILASGLCESIDGLFRFLLRTFAAQSQWTDEISQIELRSQIDASVEILVSANLVSRTKEKLKCSQLGAICAASGLRVETFTSVESLVAANNASVLDIACVAALGEDTGSGGVSLRFATFEYNGRTSVYLRELAELSESIKSPITAALLSRHSVSRPDYETAKRLKYQAIAAGFVSGVPTTNIESHLGASAAKARNIGSMCSWLCDTAAKIAWTKGRAEIAKDFERLAERFYFGCSDSALALAQVPYRMHRSEREDLAKSGYSSLQSIVDTAGEEIAKTAQVSRSRVQGLQRKIVEVLGPSLDLQRAQTVRLKACGIEVGLLEALYTVKGKLLEQAIVDLLVEPFCTLAASRIGTQNDGEADIRLILSNGRNGVAQVTAKDNPNDRIGILKACSVLQQSPELKPDLFICFGRPGFDDKAIAKARAHVAAGSNLKLIPIATLAELYVRFHEGTFTASEMQKFLESRTGHIPVDRI